MDAVVTVLNEEGEEMEKMKRQEEGKRERKQVSDLTSIRCTQLGCTFTTQTRQVLSIINDINMEHQPKRSSRVVGATKTSNSKVRETK